MPTEGMLTTVGPTGSGGWFLASSQPTVRENVWRAINRLRLIDDTRAIAFMISSLRPIDRSGSIQLLY